jgi:putative transposase
MFVPSRASYPICLFVPSATPVVVSYPSDVDDATWELIAPVLAKPTKQGRPRRHSDRVIYNAILYVLRGGSAWRMLPKSFPPWQTVYGRFRTWADNGTWQKLTQTMRQALRIELGRDPDPSAGVIDSQSVATGPGAGIVGNDAGKKVRGRKRHLLVDTEGLLVSVVVTPANVQDPTAAPEVLTEAKEQSPRLSHVWGDARYQGKLIGWASKELGITVEIVSRLPGQKGFVVLPRRWVVERSFAWLGRYRRLARDWEAASWSACALIHIAASNMMARRIARYRALYQVA